MIKTDNERVQAAREDTTAIYHDCTKYAKISCLCSDGFCKHEKNLIPDDIAKTDSSFEDFKNQVAVKNNFVTWQAFEDMHFYGTIKWRECMQEATTLFVESERKRIWDKACEAQMNKIMNEVKPELLVNTEYIKNSVNLAEYYSTN